ncbi:MBL fold metallo-hydrolase [Prolixibacter denitrificans]|uniref:MBL fold hydrolase n=2 Tax=Prolixibacter denitrificans TaxID=1541063 RepID=A0ABQ0ZFE5_9BACT|nr:MBL fold metallo-hydrolase [Prolixibacter denitrificans]GET20067.1 MBL fold hydrolase [Prolixibacter denitrificans]
MMEIRKFTFNPVAVNTYVVWDETGECAIIDAGCSKPAEEAALAGFIEEKELTPVKLLNTHGHFDHVIGNGFAARQWDLEVEMHKDDNSLVSNAKEQGGMFGIAMHQPPKPAKFFDEGDEITFGNTTLKVIHVPGHSPGGVAFHNAKEKMLIAGDILFYGSVGRTDLPGGEHEALITGIKSKLLGLDPATKVFPGHGPETTIGDEIKNNPFLQ